MTADGPPSGGAADELRSLLEYLKRNRGFDFSGYKTTSLERRIRNRMDAVGVETYAAYEDYLEVQSDEFTDLFNTILINVTGFFRDPPAWDFVAKDVIPKLLGDLPADQPIRVWSAACASGEEPYTIAILLAEALGQDAFRSRVKIYGTDVDEDALAAARQATYSPEQIKAVPEDLRGRYFEESDGSYTFDAELRRSVIFGRNDLVSDAPISRVDLLVSRNALIYFTPETQAQILRRFNFSLNDTGFLFLGKSEMLITHSDVFTPHDLRWRIFRRVRRPGMRERYAFVTGAGPAVEDPTGERRRLRDDASDVSPIAQLVVDSDGVVAAVNQAAQSLFRLEPEDVGRPIQDLEVSYRPVDLRTALDRAYETQQAVHLGRVEWHADADDLRTLQVDITPIASSGTPSLGASIVFVDVTAHAELDREHAESKRELETAYEELQSTVEELETTNEELQSTNEELETMNEELKSTNDELEVVNEEQSERSAELDRLNLFLEGILGNLALAVVVVDRNQHVQLWNESATEMWGLRSDEVLGNHFFGLDVGLPVDELREPLLRALEPDPAESRVTVDAVNRRGRSFRCAVRTLPLLTPNGDTYGAIVLMSDSGPP